MVSKDSKIIVVGGAGTMGSSTALHLARRGYTNILLLDMFAPPSANSAGNDMNKLISTQYVAGIWGRLSFEAWDAWVSDELFRPFLHATGRVDLATCDNERARTLRKQYELSCETGRSSNVEWLEDGPAIKRRASYLQNASIDGWKGLWCEDAGWVAARDALRAVGKELESLGVESSYGDSGTFKSLLLGPDGKTVRGVRTADGTEWEGSEVIMATGAWSPVLLDLEGQCTSKGWTFAHMQLTPEETLALRDTPPVYCSEYGFTMEPSAEGVMKWVNEFEGYTHYTDCQPFGASAPRNLSVPRAHALNPRDTIPDEGLAAIRRTIDTLMPEFSNKELFDTAMCWCTDSFDGNWLIGRHPQYDGLTLATGDCGHTFKMLPIVGRYVADAVEGKLSPEDSERWKWRPELNKKGETGREGPQPKDLADVAGWKHE